MPKSHISALCLFLPLAVLGMKLDFDPVSEPEKTRLMYLAPEGFLFYRLRLPDGQVQLLEKDFSKKGAVRGADGWKGSINDGRAVIRTPRSGKIRPAEITFLNGMPTMASRGAKHADLGTEGERPLLPYDESPLFECMAERMPPSSNPDGYWQDGRLSFPYENPNSSAILYAGIGILALLIALRPGKIAVATGLSISSICLALLFWTASRGGLLAFFTGAGSVLALRFRAILKKKSVLIAMGAAFVCVGIWFCVAPPRLVTRGSGKGGEGWSNRVRLELWHTAPKMMVDAPGGWKISKPGPAYVDWYQPFGHIAYSGSLMNDHLTWMAAHGWTLRFAYVFAWFMALALAGRFALETKNAVPFGCWSALAIAAWFNPVLSEERAVFIWLPAVAATVPMFFKREWLKPKPVFACAAIAAAGAAAAMSAICILGSAQPRQSPQIHAEGRRVAIGGERPDTWVVDDGFALGGLMFGRDIRAYFRKNPGSIPIGYVKNVEDLPKLGIRRLALAGRAGDDYLRKTCSSPDGPRGLPPEIVFLSPPFPPQAIPAAVFAASKVSMYVGEFATWHSREYDSPPAWMTVVPGTIRYFPEWMRYATGGRDREGWMEMSR